MLTLALIVVTVLISLIAWQKEDIFYRYALSPFRVHAHGEYYRLLTHAFLHVDIAHLGFNLLTLYFFGTAIETLVGGGKWIIIGFLGLVGSAGIETLRHQKNPSYLAVGASGYVSSFVFAYITLRPYDSLLVFFIPMPAWLFAVLYLAYSMYAARHESHIAHTAHIAGALIGVILMTFLYPELIWYRWSALLR
ncbi:MAG: rhomboid family intramembrane serine protease [Bacteroidia bacterium]